jgi:hypothetical protein
MNNYPKRIQQLVTELLADPDLTVKELRAITDVFCKQALHVLAELEMKEKQLQLSRYFGHIEGMK